MVSVPASHLQVLGGAEGIRTPDPLHAMEVRYQLRYSPATACTMVAHRLTASPSLHNGRPCSHPGSDRRVDPGRGRRDPVSPDLPTPAYRRTSGRSSMIPRNSLIPTNSLIVGGGGGW